MQVVAPNRTLTLSVTAREVAASRATLCGPQTDSCPKTSCFVPRGFAPHGRPAPKPTCNVVLHLLAARHLPVTWTWVGRLMPFYKADFFGPVRADAQREDARRCPMVFILSPGNA